MTEQFRNRVARELEGIDRAALRKPERVILSRQGSEILVADQGGSRSALNFCANNYLGLAGDDRIARAAAAASETWGAGTASVRFICGTLGIHKTLEQAIAEYLGFEDAILFAAAFDANGGVFEPLFGDEDAIVSDSLNHASIIDGVRLCKARRYRFANGDMADLEERLETARREGARDILVVTDGVFSMDGYVAKLHDIVGLASRFDALVMVDDCHATGVIGPSGKGSFARAGVDVDIVTGTFGKALGGSMGGFVCARAEVIDLLRQRARPYLFSNALAPAICGATLEAIAISSGAEGDSLRARLTENARLFREGLQSAAFRLLPGEHPIIPVMVGDAQHAQAMAAELLAEGLYVTAFSYPVVPHGQARIRTQMSAAHEPAQIEQAIRIFADVGRRMKVNSS